MPKPEPTEIRQFGVELRSVEGKTITGLAAPYGQANDVGPFIETLRKGVFQKSVTESARSLPLMTLHDHSAIPIGKAVAWQETDEGLFGEWELDSRAEAREMARLIEADLMRGLSIGFLPIRSNWTHGEDRSSVERVEARLLETSLVAVPAYPNARVMAIRSAGNPEDPATKIVPTPNLQLAKAWLESIRQR